MIAIQSILGNRRWSQLTGAISAKTFKKETSTVFFSDRCAALQSGPHLILISPPHPPSFVWICFTTQGQPFSRRSVRRTFLYLIRIACQVAPHVLPRLYHQWLLRHPNIIAVPLPAWCLLCFNGPGRKLLSKRRKKCRCNFLTLKTFIKWMHSGKDTISERINNGGETMAFRVVGRSDKSTLTANHSPTYLHNNNSDCFY